MTAGESRGPEPSAVRIRVSGRVQGVGFRYFIIRHAEAAGAVGYARNLADGDVEIWAEGAPAAVAAVEEAARRGPRGSRVENVDVRRGEVTGSYRGFGVRY
ncbi:MAG: acylphosphatase [Acidobacteriota bacterium]|nr:acylphosphatase [Acidobacteriota bacterium]